MLARCRELLSAFRMNQRIGQESNTWLFNKTVIGIAVSISVSAIVVSTFEGRFTPTLIILSGCFILLGGHSWLEKRGQTRYASILLALGLIALLVISAYHSGGLRSPSFGGLLIVSLFVVFLLGLPTGLIYAALFMLAGVILWIIEANGGLPSSMYSQSHSSYIAAQVTYVVGALMVLYFTIIRKVGKKKSRTMLQEPPGEIGGNNQSTSEAIVILGDDGKIVFWSRAAEVLFGYREDEVVGRLFTMLIPETSVAAHAGMFSRWVEPDYEIFKNRTIEGSARRNGGEEFPVELSLATWKLKKESYICAFVRLVMDKEEAEKHLIVQERMAAVGSLAAGVAHDFNNALLPVILYCEILLEDRTMDTSAVELLEVIRHQAQHAASLTQQIMDFSKLSQAKMQPLDLELCLREFKKLLDRTFPENIYQDFEYGSSRFCITGDTNRMQQALLNLAINARDAMPNGGELRFRLSCLHLSSTEPPPFLGMPPGEWVRLDVTDTGEGILAENLSKIYDPFFTTKDNGGGHGLGLAQVYSIVKQHQGFIDVVSRFGKGTTFTLYLPALIDSLMIEEETEMEVSFVGDQESILVVEDDDATRQAIRDALEFMNYRVWEAGSGRDAIDIYEQENVNLVLCDMVMPKMSGAELYEQLRERDPDVKMVIITGYPFEECGDELMERGIVGFIQKPANIKTVSLSVSRALRGESPHD